jgi:predicted site-specific integrase-resolvase
MNMSINEFAAKMGVNRKTVYEWLKKDYLIFELTPSGRKRIIGIKEK